MTESPSHHPFQQGASDHGCDQFAEPVHSDPVCGRRHKKHLAHMLGNTIRMMESHGLMAIPPRSDPPQSPPSHRAHGERMPDQHRSVECSNLQHRPSRHRVPADHMTRRGIHFRRDVLQPGPIWHGCLSSNGKGRRVARLPPARLRDCTIVGCYGQMVPL